MTDRYKKDDPKLAKRTAQLAEDWQWLASTAQGRRIIAHIMVWGNVYNPITDHDPIKMAMQVGENNFAKEIAFFLGYRADKFEFAQRSWDDTDLLDRMLTGQPH
jgi:hypothetical protein